MEVDQFAWLKEDIAEIKADCKDIAADVKRINGDTRKNSYSIKALWTVVIAEAGLFGWWVKGFLKGG